MRWAEEIKKCEVSPLVAGLTSRWGGRVFVRGTNGIPNMILMLDFVNPGANVEARESFGRIISPAAGQSEKYPPNLYKHIFITMICGF
jgi:hypothetical protein